MPIFKLSATVTVSAYTTIEADTQEEALKIAHAREVVIGGHGTGMSEDENWIIDDADGMAENIHTAD